MSEILNIHTSPEKARSRGANLTILPDSDLISTAVYAGAAELPVTISEGYAFEADVQLLPLEGGAFCLSHGTRLEQIYGGKVLQRSFEDIQRSQHDRVPRDLVECLLE